MKKWMKNSACSAQKSPVNRNKNKKEAAKLAASFLFILECGIQSTFYITDGR